ncbi:hypothetical protein ACVRYP_08020 [Streptococcus rifensis]
MLIYPDWDGIPEELQTKIVLFDFDETKKSRSGIEIKPNEEYKVVGFSNENRAPIFIGIIVGENKNNLRVASTNTRLDSFLCEYVSKKDKLIKEITSLECELEEKVDFKKRELNDLADEIEQQKNQLKELQLKYKNCKKLVDSELRKNFYNGLTATCFLNSCIRFMKTSHKLNLL